MTNEETAAKLKVIRNHSEYLVRSEFAKRRYILEDMQVRLFDLERELLGQEPRSWDYTFAYPMSGE